MVRKSEVRSVATVSIKQQQRPRLHVYIDMDMDMDMDMGMDMDMDMDMDIDIDIGIAKDGDAIAAIAQLGERQTEDLKVPGSIPGLGTCLPPSFSRPFCFFIFLSVLS